MARNGPSDLASSLHADDRWLRDLARRMLRDTSLADDAAQATWMSVLRSPPKGGLSRGFLATALRHAISKLRRGDSRRAARERAVATGETVELGDVIEKMELRRVLLDAVLELDPIYRDVVLLRFHQDLTPTAIAERIGIPTATVKTRLRRAEEQLAQRLDGRAGGDRRRYLPALVATAEPTVRDALLTLILGGIVMGAKHKIVGVLVAAMVVAGGWVLFERGDEAVAARDRSATVESPSRSIAPPVLSGDADAPGEPVERAPAETATGREAEVDRGLTLDDTRIVEGIVCDVEGRVIPHARLSFEFSVTRAEAARAGERRLPEFVADAEGRFALTIPRDAAGSVVGAAPGIATLFSGTVQPKSQAVAPVVVLAPGVAIAGEVVDQDARRVGGVEIALRFPESVKAKIPFPLENARQTWDRVTADADGFFAFEGLVPSFEDVRIYANASGYLTYVAPIPTADERGMRIVLERPAPQAADRVRGQVVDSYGAPVAGADVILGAAAGVSDEGGRFDLDAKHARTAKVIRAVAKGAQPGEVAWPLDPPRDFVVIALGPPALSIRGIVRGAGGEAVPRAVVQPADGVPLGFVAPHGILRNVEERAGGFDQGVDTAEDGGFELSGLSPRDYRLRVYLPLSGASWTTPPIAAGRTDVVIELPEDLTIPELRGRVVDRDGLPVSDVHVSITATRWECSYLDTKFASTSGAIGTATSGADGRFALVAVPKQGAMLAVDGEDIVGKAVAVPADPSKPLEIVVSRRRFLRLELDAPGSATKFGVLDAEGKTVELRQEEDGGVRIASAMELSEGRSVVTIVPDSARTVVIYAGDRELRRIEIEFTPGGVTVVR